MRRKEKLPLQVLATAVLALAPLLPACGDDVGASDFSSDVEECAANLRSIYAGLIQYQSEHGSAPQTSGVGFFATLIASGTWENTDENALLLTCPGVPIEQLSIAGKAPTERYAKLEGLDGGASAYAGRDQADHPLSAFPGPGTEALMACDNHGGANHAGVTNVLMADGSVVALELELEKAAGNAPAEAEVLVVGPESPLAELRSLSLD